jgi:DNA-binding NarL/FixJ family response regulator
MKPPLNIYLVEDSPEIRQALIQTLESIGDMRVVGFADNAPDAIRAMGTLPIDIAVCDIQLREGSGLEVLAYLQNQAPERPIIPIVLTNLANARIRSASQRLGAHYFFDKAIEFEQAIALLHEYAVGKAELAA